MVKLRLVATGLALCTFGCSALLGGLDEANTRSGTDASAPASRCGAWLEGFRYRVPLEARGVEAVEKYQVKVMVDTARLVASGKMRKDGADLRITSGDGTSVVPYWIEGGIGTEATVVWTRLDLAVKATPLFLYYGQADATDRSSLSETFEQGVIDSPAFDRPEAWPAMHIGRDPFTPSRTNEWSAVFGPGTATVRIVRPGAPNGAGAGICQTALFPAGSKHRLVLDTDVTLADHGGASMWLDAMNADPWKNTYGVLGVMAGVESPVIDPGVRTLCLGVRIEGGPNGQAAEATYSKLRVRRWVPNEPQVAPAGAEQSCP
jgi:hypothetical protein